MADITKVGRSSSSEEDRPSNELPPSGVDDVASQAGGRIPNEIDRDQPTHGYNLRSRDGLEQRLRRRANGIPSPMGNEMGDRENSNSQLKLVEGSGLGPAEALEAYSQRLLTPSHFSGHPRDVTQSFFRGAPYSAPTDLRGNSHEYLRHDRGEMLKHVETQIRDLSLMQEQMYRDIYRLTAAHEHVQYYNCPDYGQQTHPPDLRSEER